MIALAMLCCLDCVFLFLGLCYVTRLGNGDLEEVSFDRINAINYPSPMLFMVIENFKDAAAIGQRLLTKGRMLPDDVKYHASWIDAARNRCFQIMEGPHEGALRPWLDAWSDLVEFEIVPVMTSSDFWSAR